MGENNVNFGVFTVVTMKNAVLSDDDLESFRPEDGSDTFFKNVSSYRDR
jgi:hypothetical protein